MSAEKDQIMGTWRRRRQECLDRLQYRDAQSPESRLSGRPISGRRALKSTSAWENARGLFAVQRHHERPVFANGLLPTGSSASATGRPLLQELTWFEGQVTARYADCVVAEVYYGGQHSTRAVRIPLDAFQSGAEPDPESWVEGNIRRDGRHTEVSAWLLPPTDGGGIDDQGIDFSDMDFPDMAPSGMDEPLARDG